MTLRDSAAALADDASEKLAALDLDLDKLHLEGHWRLTGSIAAEPAPFAKPYAWRWKDIRTALLRAGEIHSIGGGGRRTVRLCTPGLDAKWATPTIHASIQMVKTGEIAETHRHSMSALRYVVEGSGGYTTVEGVKLRMEPGDLILTPSQSWHDHGNEGDEPVIWIDGHDFPILGHLRAQFNELHNSSQQMVRCNDDHTRLRTGALRPTTSRGRAANSLPYVYKGKEARALLLAMSDDERDSAGNFVIDYVDPVSGGHTMPTIACRLHRIPKRSGTKSQRATLNSIFAVVSGGGQTETASGNITWETGDMFVVPGWTWHRHVAAGDEDAILFDMNDEPILKSLGLFRSEIGA